MAVRLNKRHSDMVRTKIQASQLINRLQDHVFGKNELSTSQLKAAEILLNKSLPNLQSTELKATVENVRAEELSDAELASIAAGSSGGTLEAQSSAQEPPEVH